MTKKNTNFNNRNKHKIKTTTTAVTKNELKYFPMPEGIPVQQSQA